jgi:hypothetical protein
MSQFARVQKKNRDNRGSFSRSRCACRLHATRLREKSYRAPRERSIAFNVWKMMYVSRLKDMFLM